MALDDPSARSAGPTAIGVPAGSRGNTQVATNRSTEGTTPSTIGFPLGTTSGASTAAGGSRAIPSCAPFHSARCAAERFQDGAVDRGQNRHAPGRQDDRARDSRRRGRAAWCAASATPSARPRPCRRPCAAHASRRGSDPRPSRRPARTGGGRAVATPIRSATTPPSMPARPSVTREVRADGPGRRGSRAGSGLASDRSRAVAVVAFARTKGAAAPPGRRL
jgi:hypothetical protein